MKKLILILCLGFSTQVAVAQKELSPPSGAAAEQNLRELGSDNTSSVVRTFDTRYAGIKGTPFFLEKWGKATVTVQDKYIYKDVVLKYNVYENNLHYLKSNGAEMMLEPHQVDHFILTDSTGLNTYTFKKLAYASVQDKKAANKFYLMLYEGNKMKLAVLPVKSLVKADFKGGYSAGRTHDQFVNEKEYYFADADNALQKVKLNKKTLLKLVTDKQSQMQAYLDKEKIDASTEQGWVKALAYYESL